jgi:hypothetical protein
MGFINETDQSYYEGNNVGGYQYVSIDDIINNFLIMFTGEGKVIPKSNRTEVQMHAKRAIQEFSYDVFKSFKGQEIEISPTLTARLPIDYVNYVSISWVDQSGLERILTPQRMTSNPSSIVQDSSFEYTYDVDGNIIEANESVAWTRFKANTADASVEKGTELDDVDAIAKGLRGERFGLDPSEANANGTYYIDDKTGLIHFSGGLNGSIVHLKYISDGMATDSEMVVHKFAEDAMYKYILYAILSVTMNAQEYLVRRYKKSFVAAKRVAKIRLSNFKSQEMAQALKGKSKQIKH